MRYRIEKDSLGEKIIPSEAYYGINSIRSKEAFEITKHGLCRQHIKVLALVKKNQAKTNYDLGLIDKKKSEAIMLSCDEILNGRLHGQFITDSIQDGYGYGMILNASEVIANRANEMLGGDKGKYDKIKLEEVDLYQDNDEMVTTVGKITALRLLKKLITEGKKLVNLYEEKANEATDSELREQILSFASVLEKDIKRLTKSLTSLLEMNYGSKITINGDKDLYIQKFVKNLNAFITEKAIVPVNIYDVSNNLDCFTICSSCLKNLMVNMSKSANDLKHLIVNGKLELPCIEKLGVKNENTIVLDMVRQISYYIIGNDITVSRCVEDGELDFNILKPMIFACLFESSNLVRRTIRTLREKVLEEIKVK